MSAADLARGDEQYRECRYRYYEYYARDKKFHPQNFVSAMVKKAGRIRYCGRCGALTMDARAPSLALV
jgi:hypothetical protein